jgi:hypothetical protein
VRRWTLITLIVLFVLLAVVAVYQLELAERRDPLPEPEATPTAAP